MVLLKDDLAGLERAKQYIDEHYSKRIGVQTLCRISGLYEIKLRKAFQWKYNSKPYEYQVHLRMKKAAELLASDLSTKAVSAAVGYYGSTRFQYMFKKHFGLSPSAYKRKYCVDPPVII